MRTFSDLKIASKVYLLIVCCMIGIVLIVGIGLHQLNRIHASGSVAFDNTVPSFNTLYQTRVHFNRLQIAAFNHVLNTDDAAMVALESQIQELRSDIDKAFTLYDEKYVFDEQDRRLTKFVATAIKDYYSGLDIALMLSRKSGATVSSDAQTLLEQQAPKLRKIEEAFDLAIDYNDQLAKLASADAASTKQSALFVLVLVATLLFAMLAGMGWLIAQRELARPIGTVVDALKQLSAGSLNVAISGVDRRDEVGDIARAAQVFKEFVQKLDAESWVKTQESGINAALQQAADFRAMGQAAMSKITPLIGAGHGAFYVLDAEARYTLLASYGYRERKHLSNSFRVGEGLVGQCAMEKASIMLTAPKDYIRINSGLGEGPPACVLVMPLVHGERVLGVLEVATFQAFTERERALLEAVVPTLAISMEIMDRNVRTRDLLAATQQQAERMEKQAAQLEEQSVEMEAQQAELLETENWFRSIIETAPDGMLVVNAQGRILLANPMAEQLLAYLPGGLLGANIAQCLPSVEIATEGALKLVATAARTANASSVLLDVSGSPLPDRGGRGKCMSVALRKTSLANGAAA